MLAHDGEAPIGGTDGADERLSIIDHERKQLRYAGRLVRDAHLRNAQALREMSELIDVGGVTRPDEQRDRSLPGPNGGCGMRHDVGPALHDPDAVRLIVSRQSGKHVSQRIKRFAHG